MVARHGCNYSVFIWDTQSEYFPPKLMDKQAQSAIALMACRRFALLLRADQHEEAVEAFWDAAALLWGTGEDSDYYWNEWADQMVRDIVQHRRYAILGAKQSGKSTTVMAFALALYWGAWKETSIIYRTTTLDAAETRGWGEMVRLLEAAQSRLDLPGCYQKAKPPRLIPSSESGDKKHAILCMPTKAQAEGSNKTAQGSIKGFHTLHQVLVDDELNEMPDGVEDAPAALDAEWKTFRYIGIGNPNSWDNPLGRLATPSNLKRQQLYEKNAPNRWEIENGVAIRLNAFESPNIIRGKLPDGSWPYKHLPTPATIQIQLGQCMGDENHSLMWQYIRALPPPDDATAAVLTYSLVAQMRADQPAQFAGQPTMGAGLDPAFTTTGDDCVLRFAQWGICTDGIWRVEFLDKIIIPITAEEEQDSFFHITEKVIRACKSRGIQPQNLAFDCSGTGLGIKSWIVRQWSARCHPCDSLGKPSKLKVVANPTTHDLAQGKVTGLDCFDRRVSEIYFAMRYFVENDQVRGLMGENEVIVTQGAQRKYFSENGKLSVLSKKALYNNNFSSDDLDAACVVLDMLKHKGFLPGGTMSNQVPLQQQIEDEIEDKLGTIEPMAGPAQDSFAHTRAALERMSRPQQNMFSPVSRDGEGADAYDCDLSGNAGF